MKWVGGLVVLVFLSSCQRQLSSGPPFGGSPQEQTPPSAGLGLTVDPSSSLTNLVIDIQSISGGAEEPAGLQWTLTYSPQDFSGVSVTTGAAAVAAGKTVVCNNSPAGTSLCLAYGLNQNQISDGPVAQVNLTVNLSSPNNSSTLNLGHCVSASAEGDALAINSSATLSVSIK